MRTSRGWVVIPNWHLFGNLHYVYGQLEPLELSVVSQDPTETSFGGSGDSSRSGLGVPEGIP